MSDAKIIANILGGKTGLFSRLVERYLPLIRGVCTSHVADPASQDDLVQETFLAGYLGLNRLRRPEQFGPWLAGIARHKCLSWIRTQARQEKARERMAREAGSTTPRDPVQEATRREMCAWARQEIAGLPQSTREAMVLCYLEGYTIAEAARLLGTRETALRKRLQYGRQLVGEKMLKEFGERPAKEKTEDLERRVLLALPLTTAPWKTASAQSTATVAGTAGTLAIVKIAALIALSVLGVGVAIHHFVSQPREEEPAKILNAPGSFVETAPPVEIDQEANSPVTSLPVLTTGELALQLRYRMWPRDVAVPPQAPQGFASEPTSLPRSEWPPVPNVRVQLKPLRPNQQVRKMLFEEIDLDPRFAELLTARASLPRAMDWKGYFKERGITEQDVGREETKLLKLRDKYGEKGLEELLEQLMAPAPSQDWITGKASSDGTSVFSDVSPGTYRVEVFLPQAESRLTPSPISPATTSPSGVTVATEESAHLSAATTTVHIREGKRETHTIDVTDTISTIHGTVVDSETDETLGLISLSASGEALCGTQQRIWVGSDGTFSLSPTVTGFGEFTIAGKPQGFVPVKVKGTRRLGKPTHVTVSLDRRPTISGTVRNPDASPVAGITIMRRHIDGSGAQGVATTDEEGFFSVHHDGGIITLYVSGTMSSTEDQTFELQANESVSHDFTMPATAKVVLDIRTDQGVVPQKIDMTALRSEDHSHTGGILKRQGDQYVIRHLKPARYHLVFAVRGFETVSRFLTIEDGLADVAVAVQLVRGVNVLTVQVLDAEGRPLRDADVNLMLVVKKVDENGRSTGSSSSSIAREKTDDEGLAVFKDLASGHYSAYCQGANQTVTLPHEETLVLTLKPPKIEPDVLYLDLEKANVYDALQDQLPLELEQDAVHVLAPSGTLTNRRLEVGENVVFAFKRGYPPASTVIDMPEELLEQKRAIHSNVYDEDFELVFGEGGTVNGIVETSTGQPSAKQELCVFPADLWKLTLSGSNRYKWTSLGRAFAGGARSADDGTFRIRFLAPGTYVVSTRRGDVSDPFQVVAGQEVGPVILRR